MLMNFALNTTSNKLCGSWRGGRWDRLAETGFHWDSWYH